MPIVIAVIVAILAGSIWSSSLGAVAGGVLAWLVLRSVEQRRQITSLQESLKALQALASQGGPTLAVRALAASAAATARAETTPTPPAAPPLFADTLPPALVATPAPPAGAALATAPRSTAAALRTPRQPPVPQPDPLAPIKAWLFGGNTIVKAGVAILFVGLAFLAKFASEHVHVPIEFRLAGIGAVALVLLVVGWRLRMRRAGYAQVLQGGAVAVLYLTLFVALRYYGVLAVGPAFALMVLVALLAAALAVLQNARALAVIGALGGFATPLLVSTGSGNHIALFSYYLVLDLGNAAVAWHRTWRSLNLVGFLGTFIVATAWGVLKYQSENYASSQAFLVVFFLLFVAILQMPARKTPQQGTERPPHVSDQWVQGSLLFGLPTITFVLQHGLVRDTEYGTAISALLLASLYVALAAWMRKRPQMAVSFEASLAIGTVFLTLVIPFALDARSTAGAWALEGAGLVWLGLRQSHGLPRLFGYALLLLAGSAMLYAHDRHGTPTAFFNAYFFNGLMAGAASLAAALFVKRMARPSDASPGSIASHEGIGEPLLIAWGTLWLLAAAALQIDRFVDSRLQLAAWLASFSAVALLYCLLCIRLEWPRIGLPVIAHAPLHAFGALVVAANLARPLQDGGWWVWPLALLAHGLVLWRVAPRWPTLPRDIVHALAVLVLALLGALQGRAFTADWGDARSAWAWLGWLAVPAALLVLMPRPSNARRWPLVAAPAAYQWVASALLGAALLLWTLLANLLSDGSAQPLPYVPLANPLDLGVGIALLAVWLWLASETARAELVKSPHLAIAVVGSAGFVWLNAMLIRGFHHFDGVPFRFDAWVHSLAVQTGITLLWTVTALALMWWSARRAGRLPWMVGAALLAAVVAKLLLVDLSGSGTVTRIVSFIGVGVMMLVIGYVAPLPGKGDRHVST